MADNSVWDKGRWAKVTKVDIDFMTKYIIEHLLSCTSFENKRLLELGAGTGRLSYLLLQHGAKHVTMVDNSRKALALSTDLFSSVPNSQYSIVDSDVFGYGADAPFDIVFSSGLIEHFKGGDRLRIIRRHVELTSRDSIIIFPSNRLYNRVLDRTPMARRRYGFAETYSDEELKGYLEEFTNVEVISSKRFHFFYAVPLLHNLEVLSRACDKIFLGRTFGGLNLVHLRSK